MKKLRGLKCGVLLGVCLFLVGASPGCQRMVNLYNGLVMQGESFTAKLVCSSSSWESVTSQLSSCRPVSGQLCDCRFYANGSYVGIFDGCFDIDDYCEGDATLKLQMDGDDLGLFMQCVTKCGDSVSKADESYESGEILDFIFTMEDGEEILELLDDE